MIKKEAFNNAVETASYPCGKNKRKLDLFMLHKNNSTWTNCGKQKLELFLKRIWYDIFKILEVKKRIFCIRHRKPKPQSHKLVYFTVLKFNTSIHKATL